jgi:CubicO group peptidase (beta-lactamase class C family)
VTAIGVLQLVRRGELPLDVDVNELLRDWRLPRDEYQGEVTLRRLLSHSAGTSTPGFEGYRTEEPLPDLLAILDGLPPANSAAVRLIAPPGERFAYSGGGYLIVQQLVEETTGQPFGEYMRQRVFEPLGMQESYYAPLDPALHPRAATGHVKREPIPGKGPIHAESAAGGLWTTPTDLALLLLEVMRAYRGASGPVLDPDAVHEMLTPLHWEFGLGTRVLGAGRDLHISHGGATRGWHGDLVAYPARGQAIVVLTNGASGYVLWPEIERAVAARLGWPGWTPDVIEPAEPSTEELEAYAGTYTAGAELKIAVRVAPSGDGLLLGDEAWPAVPTTDDTFELLDFRGQALFARDGDGAVTDLEVWFDMPCWSPYRRWRFRRAGE